MIRDDPISYGLSVFALLISVYLATFELALIVIFPGFLLVGGLAMQHYSMQRGEKPKERFHYWNIQDFFIIIGWSCVAFIGIYLAGLGSSFLGRLDIAGENLVLFGILMAIAEERFFRGFLTNLFWIRTRNIFGAVIISAIIFAVFHFAVYGGSYDTLLYIGLSGIILASVGIFSKRLSPCMIAHVLVNYIALGGLS